MGNQRDSRPDKVEPLYITEEMACDDVMDERLQKQIKKEADEIENCLMKSEELKDVKTPDGMLDEIIGKLKNKGIWDEQEEIPESVGGETEPAGKTEERKKERVTEQEAVKLREKSRTIGSKKAERTEIEPKETEPEKKVLSEQENVNVYKGLSEEDQKALELGRQLLNQKAEEAEKNRKKSKKWKARTKRMAAVAAVLVCVFGVSVRSEAGRAYFMKMWNFVSGNELSIKINKTGTGDVIRSLSEDEERMNQEIEEKLGVAPIRMLYIPENMVFQNYSINLEIYNCIEIYEIDGLNFNIQIFNKRNKNSLGQKFDGELAYTIETGTKQMQVPVYKIKDDEGKDMFIAQFEYDEGYYIISSSISKEKFTKILQNIEIKKIREKASYFHGKYVYIGVM